MTLGMKYAAIIKYLLPFKGRIIEYINSQKEFGYLLLDKDTPIDINVISFYLGQHKFAIELICLNHQNSILIRTYRITNFPEKRIYHLPDMDLTWNLASNSILTFKVPKEATIMGSNQTYTMLREIGEEYYGFLEVHIMSYHKS